MPRLCFWDGLGLSFFSGVFSVLAAILPVFVLFWVSFTDGCVFSDEGCIVSDAAIFPVIAKGENPGVCAVKYRYLSSSPDRLVGSWFHVLPLYLFRVIEDWSIFLDCIQDFSTLKHTTAFSIFFGVANPLLPTQILRGCLKIHFSHLLKDLIRPSRLIIICIIAAYMNA